MLASVQVPNPGIKKIRDQLLAAKQQIESDQFLLETSFRRPLPSGKAQFDHTADIAVMRQHLKALREAISSGTEGGSVAQAARDITARTLNETEGSLEKLAEVSHVPDQTAALTILAESVRLSKQAKASSELAAKALGIPWPF